MLDRALELIGNPTPSWNRTGLRALRFLILLHAATRTWGWVSLRLPASLPLDALAIGAFAVAMSAAAALALVPRFTRYGPALAALLLSLELFSSFPGTPNHVFLEYVVVVLFVFFDVDSEEEGPLLLAGLRWVTAIVLFYTGVQKLLNGYYVNGEFLVWAVSVRDRFADAFSLLLPAAELTRIRDLDGMTPGSGPYRTDAISFLLASNAVWLVEVALAILLVVRRTRWAATIVAVAFVFTIQLGAREVIFALLFAQLLLTFPGGDWNRRAAPVLVFAYGYLLAYLVGLVPGEFLVRGSSGL